MAAHATPQPHGARTLLLLLTALATALACQHLRPRDAIWDSIQLLRDMAPTPAQPCHHQQVTFRFPDILLTNSNPQQAAVTALRMLHHLFAIFSSSTIPQQWDTQARHQLLNNLHHYIHHLEQCLPANDLLFQRQGPRNLLLATNTYFADIQDFLHTHNHSACAWDHVRLQARACFRRVDTLIRRMKSQAAPALLRTHPHPTPIDSRRQQPQIQRMQQSPRLGLLNTAHASSSQEPAATGKRA